MPDDLFRSLLLRLLALPAGTPTIVAELCCRVAIQWQSVCRIEPAAVALIFAETKDELLKCVEQVCKEPQQVRLISLLNNRFLTYGSEKAYDTIMKAWVPLEQVLPSTTMILSFNIAAHWYDIQQQHQAIRSRHSHTDQQPSGS